jgi:predicted permease
MFGRKRKPSDFNAEVEAHLELEADRLKEQGLSDEEARMAAGRTFGNVTRAQERFYESGRWVGWDHLVQDIRFGLRMLRKNPGVTAVAVTTLALGIGANAAIFSVVDSFLLRPLPVADPGQITIFDRPQKKGFALPLFSIPDYRDLRDQTTKVFSGMFAYLTRFDGLSVNGKAERIRTHYISGNFFSTLGIKPALGRFILPSEGETPGADPVMVLSYTYWRERFGGDAGIVGTNVSVDGHPVTIVGVAPEGFYGINLLSAPQAYLPLGMAVYGGPADFITNRAARFVFVGARLQPGESLPQAQALLDGVARRLSQQYSDTDKDFTVKVYPELRARPIPQAGSLVVVLSGLFLGLTAIVLLLACVNVANILLVRSAAREREMATRAALGALRSRLVRQLLTESVLLALAGGVAGILFGYWGTHALGSIDLHANLSLEVRLDWRVLAYSLGVAILTGLIVGLVPALRAARGDLSAILRGGRGVVGGRQRLRTALVVAQVAGSLMLLISAGLFMRSLGAARQTNLGFNPSHVINLSMDPREIGYTAVQSREFYKTLLERVRALPGVLSVSTAPAVPMGYVFKGDTLVIDGYQPPPGQPAPNASYNVISPDYFQTMRIPMVRGRTFTDADDETSQYVAIVNQTMAQRFWPNQDPLGRQFTMARESKHPMQLVGVARNSRFLGVVPSWPIDAYFFVPYAQHYEANSLETLQVRTVGPPEPMIPEVERVIATLAPDLPVFDAQTMTEALHTLAGLLIFEIGALLAAAFGILGLILAIIGVYGVISYAVSQRTHEIGIRMAFGADSQDVLRMTLGEGFIIVGAGLTIGMAGALAAARVVRNFVSVSATDPLTYLAVSATLAVVSLLACYIPARRATKVDPIVALRYE